METTKVTIDENHVLDIYDGEELRNQPMETQDAYYQWQTETGFNPYWKIHAQTFDNFNRPLTWHYEFGELVIDLVVTYKYPKNKKNWTWETERLTLSANTNNE